MVVLPLTRTGRRIPVHVQVDPPEGGLTDRSYILVDAICSIAKERLNRRWGTVTADTMARVDDHLAILLDL